MITLSLANLYAIVLVAGLVGGTLAMWGGQFLEWTDAHRGVGNDEIDEYRERAA